MNVSLSPEMQRYVDEKVRSGQYSRPEDVIHAGLGSLISQENFGDFAPGELDKLLAEGEQSVGQAGWLDGEDEFQKRRARRMNGQPKAP